MSIYREIILDHYKHPKNFREIKGAQTKAEVSNSLCGDSLTIFITFVDGAVSDVSFLGVGCAISVASASMLTEYVKGKSIDEIQSITSTDITELLGIELSPSRLKCALLSQQGLIKAIENLA